MTSIPEQASVLLTDEQKRIWDTYRQVNLLLEDWLDQQMQRDFGIPHLYYELMALLEQAPGHRLRMIELARSAKITRSRLTHAIARLEKHGWVRRASDPLDGRGMFAVLTVEGCAVVEQSAPDYATGVRSVIFDLLSPDQVARMGEIFRIISDCLHTERGADLPWLR
ncbi:MarR family winged helix-turn-helix transcriptional regulator [Streptomyces chartreusis]|uniref:MarR family winged helix-turn-helix transcriptional regulator n=1 Tax=Streptomyces chartreusis TaxID=1969 RepID=UPI00367DACE8